jgi:hypothetical protein
MNRIPLSFPELGIISGTRAMLGAGVGLLLADRLNDDQRRAVGWTLVAVGAITTVPILLQLRKASRDSSGNGSRQMEQGRMAEREFAS